MMTVGELVDRSSPAGVCQVLRYAAGYEFGYEEYPQLEPRSV
jgi:hypothetical protein